MATTGASTAGHRREKRDFARACNPRIGAYVALIDRATDHVRIFECIGIALTLVGEPRHQIADPPSGAARLQAITGWDYLQARLLPDAGGFVKVRYIAWVRERVGKAEED